jgi:hypothetical protein
MAAWVFVGFCGSLRAQKAELVETPNPKDVSQVEIKMRLTGERIFDQDGQRQSQKVTATAEHRFDEKVLAVHEAKGERPRMVAKAARKYQTAKGTIIADGPITKTVRPDRSLAVAQRGEDGTFLAYSLGGPLTREELDILSEHFDTLCLAGVLPGKEVAKGDTWRLHNAAVLGLCQFEGLVAHEVKGTLKEVDGDKATFTIAGNAQGIELGATVELKITATGTFDLANHRISSLEWKQEDNRGGGPASPAFKAEVVVNITRTTIAEPKELTDSALETVPQSFEVPATLTALIYRDPKARFELSHARDWKFNGRTDQHSVFRLLDRGDFVAQATITPWTKSEPGQHQSDEDFKKDMMAAPDFETEQILQEGEIKTGRNGWYIYRMSAQGTTGGIKSVQTFFLVAAPNGEQLVVAFTMNQTQVGKLGARDLTLVEGLMFGEKK